MAGWGRRRIRVGTWDAAERRRRALAWADGVPGFGRAAEQFHNWIIADTGPGRLLPWLPVAFGFGIAIYFTADREPAWWAGSGLAVACCVIAFLVRQRPVAFPIALACAAITAGFTVATLKTVQIAHPVLARPAGNVAVAGFVEVREERERTDRIRVSVKKGTAPSVGAYVTFRARLSPPLEPLRPGGYDFARDLYFQGIGATGFVLGAIKPAEAPSPPGLWLRYAASIQGLRDSIDARIRSVVPGDKGSIASALITGKRDAITTPVNDAMYVSSLAHVLSISGYHLG
jgi:competence protein ComEC